MARLAVHIALLGDSTLDNVVWVQGRYEDSVPSLLLRRLRTTHPHILQSNIKVTNYAADGFTTSDVLHGAVPFISGSARLAAGDPFPESADGKGVFAPMDHLQSLSPSHVVLSVGGNDVREILGNMSQLQSRIDKFWRNYPRIIEQIQAACPNAHIIIMTQYKPCHSKKAPQTYGVYEAMARIPGPGSPMDKLTNLISFAYSPIFELAARHRIPVVHLSDTFDADEPSLYELQIEPSARGGAVIANLVEYVVRKHNFETAPATRYWIPPQKLLSSAAADSIPAGFREEFVQSISIQKS
eukprot:ANDGO_06598.mRNA.1 hypothetical protein